MAVLSKIRDRSGFLIIIIGLAMVSFVINPKDVIDFFSNKNGDVVGVVNEKEISHKDYATRVENFKTQRGQENYGWFTVENLVWNQMVDQKLYESKLKEAGVVIGEQEIWKAITTSSGVVQSPQFKGANGFFDENLLKKFIADLQNAKTPEEKSRLKGWLNYEKSIKENVLTQAYNNLIKSGIVVSKKEAENNYLLNNTSVSADYVFLSYGLVDNTEVKVTKDEVADYLQENSQDFQTEAKRDLKFVRFTFKASKEDEEGIKNELVSYIEDKEEYNKISKATETVQGFKNVANTNLFIEEVGSDLPNVDKFLTESELPTVIKNDIKEAKVGAVVGPYKSSTYYNLTKLTAITKLADSAKASHILINYAGAQGAQPNTQRNLAQAQQLADSLLAVVKKSPNKFGTLAQDYSADPVSGADKGNLGWFGYNTMVPSFRDFTFENKKGTIGLVRTNFGFHIIKIQDQKGSSKAYKLATIARKIQASEETENAIFAQAETFANALKSGGDIDKLAKEYGYAIGQANGLKSLEGYVGQLGENRPIVKWAFNEDTELNTSKRFDLDDKGYAVVALTGKQNKGLESVSSAFARVEPELVKLKKAAILKEKMEGNSLETIAKANQVKVESFTNVSLSAPTIPGIGIEPAVLGAASALKVGSLQSEVIGKRGVYALVTKEVKSVELKDAKVSEEAASSALQSSVSRNLLPSLRKAANIQDFRSTRY